MWHVYANWLETMAISTVKGKTKSFSNPQKLIEELWEYTIINSETGCWEYQRRLKDGYGTRTIDYKEWRINKLSHHLFKSKIPSIPDKPKWRAELWILHKCHNRKCWNPSHLQAGLPSWNTKQMLDANRSGNKYGKHFTKSRYSRLGSPTETILGDLSNDMEQERATEKFQATGKYSRGLTSFLEHTMLPLTEKELDRLEYNRALLISMREYKNTKYYEEFAE
jgi:hypothetical protein